MFLLFSLSPRLAGPNTKIILVGNKSDLAKKRTVTYKEGAELAELFGCPFYEVSAKEGTNVEEAVHTLVESIVADFDIEIHIGEGEGEGEGEGNEESPSTLQWLYSKIQGLFMY